MSNTTTIKAAKIIKHNKLEVVYEVHLPDERTNKITVECDTVIHEDLRRSFASLDIHLGNLCEQYKIDAKTKKPVLATVECLHFSITGSGEKEGVTLSGHRDLENGKVIQIKAPNQQWSGDVFEYKKSKQLYKDVAALVEEVNQYLFHGKKAADPQGDLFETPKEEDEENF